MHFSCPFCLCHHTAIRPFCERTGASCKDELVILIVIWKLSFLVLNSFQTTLNHNLMLNADPTGERVVGISWCGVGEIRPGDPYLNQLRIRRRPRGVTTKPSEMWQQCHKSKNKRRRRRTHCCCTWRPGSSWSRCSCGPHPRPPWQTTFPSPPRKTVFPRAHFPRLFFSLFSFTLTSSQDG